MRSFAIDEPGSSVRALYATLLRINDCHQKSESMARPESKLQVPRLSGLGHLALPTLQNAYRLGKKKNSKKWSKSGICNILPHQFFYLQRSGYGEGPALKKTLASALL